MLDEGEDYLIRGLLGRNMKPTEEFWKKANEYGLQATYWAIIKADQEGKWTIEHITKLIGLIVKEGSLFVYKAGTNKKDI